MSREASSNAGDITKLLAMLKRELDEIERGHNLRTGGQPPKGELGGGHLGARAKL